MTDYHYYMPTCEICDAEIMQDDYDDPMPTECRLCAITGAVSRLSDDDQAKLIADTRMGHELLEVVSLAIDPDHYANWLSPGWMAALYCFRKG